MKIFRNVHTAGLAALCAVLALFDAPAQAADTPPAMIVPGQFNVSSAGAFTYTIPIAVPPGTAGMVPALSLDYSSQNGDGLEGLGWVLSGLPSITRCPRTIAQDAVHGNVNYGVGGDTNDRFCMEGQRLVLVSGTYGADGSQYRTQIEGFSEIIAHGTSGSGPNWFEVHTKAGQIMQFGKTADSQAPLVPVSGSTTGPFGTVRAWAVNQIADTKGNYLNVTYDQGSPDLTNGQVYPTAIYYTGNAGAGVTPYNTIYFYYTTRPDVTPLYQTGSLQQTTVLLSEIKTYAGLNAVYDYKIAYNLASSGASHDELASVTLCDTNGSCLAPTTFGWQGSRDTLTMTSTPTSIAQGNKITAGDYNADGLTDLQVTSALTQTSWPSCTNDIYFGTNSGAFSQSSMTANYTYWYYTGSWAQDTYSGAACFNTSSLPGNDARLSRPVDIDGDGFTDILLTEATGASSQTTYVLRNNQTGAVNQNGQVIGIGDYGNGDFDGDGRTDFLGAVFGSGFYPYTSNGDGTFTQQSLYLGYQPALADFDGDGCTDFAGLGPAWLITYSCAPAVSTLTLPNWSGWQVVLGDFNGDGKTDFLVVGASGAYLYLSTGTGIASGILIPGSSSWSNFIITTGDWNGDGKADLMLVTYTAGGSSQLYLSTGTGFEAAGTIPNVNASTVPTVADWNSDGASDIWLQQPAGDVLYTFSYVPELMTTVSNGIGVATTVTYDRANKNSPLYTKCPNAPSSYACGDSYPTQGLDGPLYVVKRIDSSNGLGACVPPSMTNCYSSTYAYGGAKADLHGLGFLGFQQMTVTDLQTGVVQTTNYATAFPQTGLITSQTKTVGSVTINSTTNTYATVSLGVGLDNDNRYFVELTQSVVASNDLNGAVMPTVTTSYTYDCDTGGACAGTSPTGFGNVMQVVTAVSGGSSKTTTNTYSNDTSNWFLGRLLTANVQSIVGSSNLTRHTSYTYDSSSGLLTSEIVEPGASDPTLTQETDYGYDDFGNKTSATVKACVWSGASCSTTSRETTTTYDSLGQFVTGNCNALSQCETWVHDARFGLAISHTGPNGIITSWGYDTFGRAINETRADGTQTLISYAYCSGVNGGTASCPTTGAVLRLATPMRAGVQIGPSSTSYYDSLSRGFATDAQGFNGALIRSLTVYDTNGRVSETSRPFFVSGGTAQYTFNTYDALGRLTQSTLPNSGVITTTYNGLTVSVQNPNGQTTTTLKNAQGLVASVTDANSKTTSYVYDAEADLLTVTDPSSNVTTNTYDLRGRKTASSDPDMGSWSYVYDGYGELASQTDAKSQTTTLAYDALGRTTGRVEGTFTSTWVYDTAANGIGKLYSASTTAGYSRTFNYDALSRPIKTTLTIGGNAYIYQTSYDLDGRVAAVSYPSGFVATYVYTSLSYLSQIVDRAANQAIWTANSRDAELHLLQATAGNGVVTNQSFSAQTGLVQSIQAGASNAVASFAYGFDLIGNLTSRSDANEGVAEQYCYDPLNRLTTSATGTSGAAVSACTSSGTNIIDKSVAYDALGDITSKSDVGTYTYGAGAGPHAVTSIAGTVNGVVNPTYTYDLNGSMTAGAGRTITTTSFNMAATITQGAVSIAFTYDSEHARITQVAGTTTTTYLNDPSSGGTEEAVVAGGPVTWRDYIKADGNLVALRTAAPAGTPTNWGAANWASFTWAGYAATYLYFTADHLGSIAVITNQAGSVVERDSYDAWGRRRNANGTDSSSCTIATQTTRGFTGQEMMDSVCLVNLNARLYDPTIGRFLSADPVVGTPFVPQELNRFTYVLNNPLSLTDPSGLCFLGCFWKSPIFDAILDIALFFILPELEVAVGLAAEVGSETALAAAQQAGLLAVNAGIAGGLSALVTTGRLQSALLGAAQGLVTVGIGGGLSSSLGTALGSPTIGRILGQGLIGGLFSVASHGNFVSGFLSAGVGSLGGTIFNGGQFDPTALVGSAVLGGVASVLGGGKFANGAITAAFAYAASECAAGGCESQLARSNDPISGPEIPAAQREQIIGNAIATYQAQGGSGLIFNDYSTYEIANASGTEFDSYDSLAGMNAGIAQHEADSGEEWGYVSGKSNGFYSVIYASAAYPQSSLYGLSINPATSTLFIVWHENGHQGWPMGGGCMFSSSPEGCANSWAQSHINSKPGGQ